MPDESERLGPGQIHFLAWSVADGTATPAEARQLLEEFVHQAGAGPVSPRMLEHFRECVSAFLAGRKTLLPNRETGRDEPSETAISSLDKAFGLIRSQRGQPRADPDTHCEVAMQVLRELLANRTAEQAVGAVADKRKEKELPLASETQVRDAWAECKRDALIWLRASRTLDPDKQAQVWTEPEIARLRQIYADVPGIVLRASAHLRAGTPYRRIPRILRRDNVARHP